MMIPTNRLTSSAKLLFICLSGALLPLSFAPFDLWYLAIIALVIFAFSLKMQSSKTIFLHSFVFGLGFFLAGVHWVFVSIHHFGGASVFLAGFLTLIFCGFLAAVFSLPFIIVARWFSHHPLGILLALPCCWILGEWLRTWLLTGFPWLFLGYAHTTSWLAGWAPVGGVLTISFIVIFTSAVIAEYIWNYKNKSPLRLKKELLVASISVIALWGLGGILQTITWAEPSHSPIKVGMIQPNVDQSIKLNFTQESVDTALNQLRNLSEELWSKNDWVIWPEAAIPTVLTYQSALPFLEEINRKAAEHDAALFTGVIYSDSDKRAYYNSIAGLGSGYGFYHKRRLVPFGEYVPLENQLRGFIEFFDLPTSFINLGPSDQHGLIAHDIRLAPAVCYEIAYPNLIASSAQEANVLLNINNLGWFLDSIQSKQFMQMAQMRALETGRYLIYNTNNGPSAIIDNKGKVITQSAAFTAQTLSGEIVPVSDWTPFMVAKDWPLLIVIFLVLVLLFSSLIVAASKTEQSE
jgi:apolipoprotein N-acyltransferase